MPDVRPIRPPVKSHGGKWYLRDWVIDHFPREYRDMVFVEAFAGGASVFLNKGRSRLDVVNDLDTHTTNLFRVIRDQSQDFLTSLRGIAYSKPNFEEFKRLQEGGGCTEFNDALGEYVVRRMSRGGMREAFAWSERLRGGKPGDVNAWESMFSHIPRISERLQGVLISNQTFSTVMESYDDKNVLMYLDPPYLHETRSKYSRGIYTHEMQAGEHRKLLEICVKSRAKIIISGYRSELYEDALRGWSTDSKKIANHSSQAKSKSRKEETLWSNYEMVIR